VNILKMRPSTESPATVTPAATRLAAARVRDRVLVDRIADVTRQVSSLRADVEAHSTMKVAVFDPTRVEVEVGALSKLGQLAQRASHATQTLAELTPQLSALQAERAMLIAQFPEMELARDLEALAAHASTLEEAWNRYLEAAVPMIALSRRVDARAPAPICGSPRLSDWYTCWVPAEPPEFKALKVPTHQQLDEMITAEMKRQEGGL
jgi:hypothetical protein